VHFYRIGIGDTTTTDSRGWQMASLDVLTKRFNESKVRELFNFKSNLTPLCKLRLYTVFHKKDPFLFFS